MNERPFGPIWKREVVVEDEVDDAEYHDGNDKAGCRPVDDPFPSRQLAVRTGHDVLPASGYRPTRRSRPATHGTI